MLFYETYEKLIYKRVEKNVGKLKRGDVITKKLFIPSYPRTPRLLNPYLVEKHIEKPYAEEKIDGYNTRIVNIDGTIYSFLRSGLIDPFSTYIARRSENIKKLLADNDKLMLCVEFTGNTPFTLPTGKVEFFMFDIYDLNMGAFLPIKEKRKIAKHYNIPQPPLYGTIKNGKQLFNLLKKLNEECKEGVVLKSKDRKKSLKIVTPCSDINQIIKAPYLFDLPERFIEQRLFRSSLLNLETPNNIIEELRKKITVFKTKGYVFSEHQITVPPSVWKKTLELLNRGKGIKIKIKKIENHTITFEKIYKKSTQLLKHYLNGTLIVD